MAPFKMSAKILWVSDKTYLGHHDFHEIQWHQWHQLGLVSQVHQVRQGCQGYRDHQGYQVHLTNKVRKKSYTISSNILMILAW